MRRAYYYYYLLSELAYQFIDQIRNAIFNVTDVKGLRMTDHVLVFSK